MFSMYFLWSPADGQHHYEPVLDDLSAYTPYPEKKLISKGVGYDLARAAP